MMANAHTEWRARLAPLLAAVAALPPHVRGDYEALCVMLGTCVGARSAPTTHTVPATVALQYVWCGLRGEVVTDTGAAASVVERARVNAIETLDIMDPCVVVLAHPHHGAPAVVTARRYAGFAAVADALRDLAAVTVLPWDRRAVLVENDGGLASNYCDHCTRYASPHDLDATPLRQCAGCHVVPYCNTDCQTAAWPAHRLICRDLRGYTPPAGAAIRWL